MGTSRSAGQNPQYQHLEPFTGSIPGTPTKADNYYGISLTSSPAKLYNRLIFNRIREAMVARLGPRAKWIPGINAQQSVTDSLSRKKMIEVKENNPPAVLTLIDESSVWTPCTRGNAEPPEGLRNPSSPPRQATSVKTPRHV
ncbi:hypothetical protein NHX12_022100 [Muraenolepis orangiensis]|uniref:Uncharacterized protein n=1 Tax=Muraenolepis orangiensis TaxID=630683 RepID=A0A9Q0EQC9_9TELE|nr:hypothetical protein NHX12_022100 [Muraenolepis orangiensis]